MKQITRHGRIFLFDMDLREAWFKHSQISRALLVSYKWRSKHGQCCSIHRAKA